ncbi:MAG: DUF4926 domain-containing protein [Nitrospinae bacterium]|nr:DUF4926 domain-containing protein [Nitrospinota bacterium]
MGNFNCRQPVFLIVAHQVHCYRESATFEVEFVTGQGETVALLTLSPEAIRPVMGREILHVRGLEQVSSIN